MNEEESGSEQFSLRWNNFQANVTSGFESLLEGEELVDVTLAVDGRLLRAHKLVLSICSPYFKEMFKINPCQHPIVILKDVGYQEMEGLIQFMYRGEVSIAQEHLPDFLRAAELLSIKGLAANDSESGKKLQRNSLPWVPPAKKKRLVNYETDRSQDHFRTNSSDEPMGNHVIDTRSSTVNDLHRSLPKQEPADESESTSRTPTSELEASQVLQHQPVTNSRSGPFNFSYSESWNVQGGGGFQMTSRGRLQLVRNGYVYHCNRQTEDKIFWKCAEYNRTRCRSRCISVGGVVTVTHANHNHVAAMSQPRLQQLQPKLQSAHSLPDNT